MKKRAICLILAVIFIVSVFTGCGVKSDMTASKEAVDFGGAAKNSGDIKVAFDEAVIVGTTAKKEPDGANSTDAIGGGSNVTQSITNAILFERKIIRSANVSVEVEDFDEAYGKINTFILGIGFIQQTNINTEKVYVDDKQKLVKRGIIELRVDKDKFDMVLSSIKGIGDILSWNINGQDVTDKYFDVESRLRILKLEQSKLEEYLLKINDLDQIFRVESRLTEIRYEIEGLTGNLKKMSDLVQLSTITINMNEKGSTEPEKPKTYGQRLLQNLLDSFKGMASFCGELLIIVVAALPVLILLGVFVLLVVLIYRRFPQKTKGKALIAKDSNTAAKENDKKE